VAEFTRTTPVAATPPILTPGVPKKFAPLIVIGTLPAAEIVDGVTDVTLGGTPGFGVTIQENWTLEMFPAGSVTLAVTRKVPVAAVMVPLIKPVVELMPRPAGSPDALNVRGEPTVVSRRLTDVPATSD